MRRWMSIGCSVLVVVLFSAVLASAATSTLFGTQFKVGEAIQFRVEDSTTWWWGCCTCTESTILSWRVVASSGMTVYSVSHDAPVSSSLWVGSWSQTDSMGNPVPAGQYTLYVTTSAGTLSRCLSIYDPCGCYPRCVRCPCQQVSTITNCACRTSLVFVQPCAPTCAPLFWWFGTCTSGCSPCTSCP